MKQETGLPQGAVLSVTLFSIVDLCECDKFFDYEHFFEFDMGRRARRGFGITGREMLSSNDLSTLKRVIAYLKFMDWNWKI